MSNSSAIPSPGCSNDAVLGGTGLRGLHLLSARCFFGTLSLPSQGPWSCSSAPTLPTIPTKSGSGCNVVRSPEGIPSEASTDRFRENPVDRRVGEELPCVSSGAVAQLGERFVRNEEVVGSIPISSTHTNGSSPLACPPSAWRKAHPPPAEIPIGSTSECRFFLSTSGECRCLFL